MTATERAPTREGVKSAQRALSVLELLVGSDAPLTFAEIGARLDYPRSSLHGLLATLLDRHWIELDETTRRYRLGIRTFEAGNAYLRSIDLIQLARPRMERIRDALDEIVQFSVLDGRWNVYLSKVEGGQNLRLASEVGKRLQAHATALGKVLLAGLSPASFDRLDFPDPLERFTPNTLASLVDLRRDLALVRQLGYATDREEHTIGVRCYAMPIRNHAGQTVAALSVSFPTVRFTEARGEQALALLRDATGAISRDLGHRP